ncbi:MAG: HAMP domain-containing histidine kinase [Spirochaetes bacterium]|nr:HAMP domain-containing histidine kinase [Spirochaetota bacterium]
MALCILIGWVILKGQLYALDLTARNEGERFLNYLVVSLRTIREAEGWKRKPPPLEKNEPPVPDFEGDVKILEGIVQSNERLRNRVAGVGLYKANGDALVRFGSAPLLFSLPSLESSAMDFPYRHYLFNPKNRSLVILQPLIDFRRMRFHPNEAPNQFLYLELYNPNYWVRRTMFYLVFSVLEGLFLFGLYIGRGLVIRNWEYRNKLREQEELVLLGSASRALAHEFKNPLSAIALQADLLQRVCAGTVSEEVSVIREEVNRMRRMVDRIGDLIREPRGQPAVFGVKETIEGLIKKRFPQVRVEIPETVSGKCVRMDPDRFRSALENLIQNAIESTGSSTFAPSPAESVEPVNIRVTSNSKRIVIEVLDRGEGLSGKELDRLFDPFYTTKTKGFGIGLFLSKRFVEAAGGTMGIEGREGGGTVARITLVEATDASSDCGR